MLRSRDRGHDRFIAYALAQSTTKQESRGQSVFFQRAYARDRRRVAIHEAGHFVAARLIGITSARAQIFPVHTDSWQTNKTWVVNMQIALEDRQRLNRRTCRLLAVAGSVAELCWDREYVDVYYWEVPDRMSETDWLMAGCLPGEPDKACLSAIRRAAELFDATKGSQWTELCQTARKLIQNSKVESIFVDHEYLCV
jgi:hypothetical protein